MMKKMRTSALVIAVFLAVPCLGANTSLSNSPKKGVAERLEELEKQNAALSREVSDLKLRIDLLTERMNTLCGAPPSGSAAGMPGPGATAGAPPDVPGLAVVRLTPGSQPSGSPAPNKPKGRVIVVNTSGDTPSVTEGPSPSTGAPLPGTNYVPLPDPATTMGPVPGVSAPNPAPSNNPPPGPTPPSGPTPALAAPNTPPVATPMDEAGAYADIKKLVGQNKRSEAVPLMEDYLKRYLKGPHEDEVAFWLGEERFSHSDYPNAVKAYRIVTENHPESKSAPEALYKVGLSLLELNRKSEATDALEEVKVLYPFSEAAAKAEKKLASCCR